MTREIWSLITADLVTFLALVAELLTRRTA